MTTGAGRFLRAGDRRWWQTNAANNEPKRSDSSANEVTVEFTVDFTTSLYYVRIDPAITPFGTTLFTMASWGEQFSSGDQNLHHRAEFWRSGFRICQGCHQSSGMTSRSETAGCRRNGDGYGTDVFTCTKCNWSTSFQYDEASDTYYYETRDWTAHYPAASARTDDAKKAST